MTCTISFAGASHEPVRLPEGANLSEYLTIMNSPLLFGCRTGICGTCLVQVEAGQEALPGPDPDEEEALSVYAPGNTGARLACRIAAKADVTLRKIESA